MKVGNGKIICDACKCETFKVEETIGYTRYTCTNCKSTIIRRCDIEFNDSNLNKDVEIKNQEKPLKLIFHTDGACSGNPGPGGWAFVNHYQPEKRFAQYTGFELDTTNNRMELFAVIKVLETISIGGVVDIYTDSQLIAKCACNEWKRKANIRLWKTFDNLSKGKTIKVIWEPRDSSKGNKIANKLAQEQAQKIKALL